MKNVLAILAVACVATAPALAADSIASTDDDDEPTMGELAEDIEELSDALETVLGVVRGLATRGPEVALVMTVPYRSMSNGMWYKADHYLVGESTIPGFPSTVAANGNMGEHGTLPAGTYLFETHQPYTDKLICHGNIPLPHKARGTGTTALAIGHQRGRSGCPWFTLHVNGQRYNDGPVVSSVANGYFQVKHKFRGITFTDERPMSSYRGGLKITKLK